MGRKSTSMVPCIASGPSSVKMLSCLHLCPVECARLSMVHNAQESTMNRIYAVLAGLLLLVVLGSQAVPQQPPARKSMFSLLKPGQTVELASHQDHNYIRIYEDDELKKAMKHTIKEIAD